MDEITKPAEADEKEILQFVRDCDIYKMEYKECKSIKGRFQQYYVYGETLDCSKWKEDLLNCKKNENSKDLDVKGLARIIHNENERLEKRIRANLANDVWKRRSKPPDNWNSELPEWLVKREEHSFTGKEDMGSQLCIIS